MQGWRALWFHWLRHSLCFWRVGNSACRPSFIISIMMLLAQGEVWMYDTALGGPPQPMVSPLFWCGWWVVEVLVVIIYNSIRSSCSSCSNNNSSSSSSSISSRSTVQAEVQVQVKVEVQVVVMMLVLVLRSSNNGSSCTTSSTITSRITTWGPYHWRGGLWHAKREHICIYYVYIYIHGLNTLNIHVLHHTEDTERSPHVSTMLWLRGSLQQLEGIL